MHKSNNRPYECCCFADQFHHHASLPCTICTLLSPSMLVFFSISILREHICILNARLGGEIDQQNVIMYKAYCFYNFCMPKKGRHPTTNYSLVVDWFKVLTHNSKVSSSSPPPAGLAGVNSLLASLPASWGFLTFNLMSVT